MSAATTTTTDGAGGVFRIVYMSRNAVAEAPLAGEVERILAASRRNNAAEGVTGALLFNRDIFAQVLEGPPAAVERTFERIQRDPRHDAVMVLEAGPAGEGRAFADWSMALADGGASSEAAYAALAARQPGEAARDVLAMLRGVVLVDD